MPAVINLALFSSLACLAMVSLPDLIFIWGLLWGISLVISGYYLNRGQLLLVFILNLSIIYLLAGNDSLLYALAFYGIPSLLMAVLLSRGKSFYELLRWGMLTVVLSVALFLGISYLQLGYEGVNTLKTEIQSNIMDSMKMSESSGLLDFYEDQGISRQEIQATFTSMSKSIVKYIPAFLGLQAIMAVYLILYLSSALARKRKLPILQRLPFSEEIMPWQFSWVVIAGLACWLLGRDDMQMLYYVGANVLAVSVPVTVYYGTSHLIYRLRHMQGKSRKWFIALTIMLCLFFTVSAIIFIGLMGLFDSLLDYRKLRPKKEGI